MALNKASLAAAIQTAFEQAKDQEWDAPQVAQALADAIDDYVRTADVDGITVDVVDNGNNPLGTGTQTGPVQLQ